MRLLRHANPVTAPSPTAELCCSTAPSGCSAVDGLINGRARVDGASIGPRVRSKAGQARLPVARMYASPSACFPGPPGENGLLADSWRVPLSAPCGRHSDKGVGAIPYQSVPRRLAQSRDIAVQRTLALPSVGSKGGPSAHRRRAARLSTTMPSRKGCGATRMATEKLSEHTGTLYSHPLWLSSR